MISGTKAPIGKQATFASGASRLHEWTTSIEKLLEIHGETDARTRVAEVLPYFIDDPDRTDFLNILGRLGFKATRRNFTDETVKTFGFPAINIQEDGEVWIVEAPLGRKLRVIKAKNRGLWSAVNHDEISGEYYTLERDTTGHTKPKNRDHQGRQLSVMRSKRQIANLSFLAVLTSIPGLLLPLMTILLFDSVIPSGSMTTLIPLLGIVVAIAIVDWRLRNVRATIIAYTSARLSHNFGTYAISRIFDLSPSMIEQASVKAQASRIRQFERIGEQFTDQLSSFMFGLPYSLLFLAMIAIIGGWLVLVPIIAIFCHVLLSFLSYRSMVRRTAAMTEACQERDNVFQDIASSSHAIQGLGAGHIFYDRFRRASVESIQNGLKLGGLQTALETIAQSITTFAALTTMVVGAKMVMADALSTGGLIASMTLIWRVAMPWQQLLSSFPKIQHIRTELDAFRQLDRLPSEQDGLPRRGISVGAPRRMQLDGVTIVHDPSRPPTLSNVNMAINPGELVAITGPSGSGKSSLLKLLNGMERPNRGRVLLNGSDLRQINPRELREHISYFPQNPETYAGTIAQNLRLANPSATDDELLNAVNAAGLEDAINTLQDGLATRLGDARVLTLSHGFIAQIALARSYIRSSSLMLLDEPGRLLDRKADQHMIGQLEQLKRKKTIVIVTQRPSHLRLADRVLQLENGMVQERTIQPSKKSTATDMVNA